MYRRIVRDEDARRLAVADDLHDRMVAESRLMDVDRNPRVGEFLLRAVDRNPKVAVLPRGVDPGRRVLLD